MRPPPHDPPVAHDEDLVTVANRTEPVCNDDAGTSPAPEIVIDRLFDNRIQPRGGLVEDGHGRITCQRPRDLEPLSLAATEIPAVLGHVAIVVAGPDGNLLVDLRILERPGHASFEHGIVPEREVVAGR